MTRVALALAVVACTRDPTVAPVIDEPPASSTGSPFPLDQITLEVAHAGATSDILSRTFGHGDTVELAGVGYADDLVIHMTGVFSGGAVAYGRTCEIAVKPNQPVPTPHLYFSRFVHFADTPFMPEPRIGGVGAPYHDGSAIVIGGIDATASPVMDVERFDPLAGQYAVLAQLAPRTGAAVAAIGTGQYQLVVIGGVDAMTGDGASFVEAIEVETTADMRVSRIADTNMARTDLTATTLSDGSVVVIGGATPIANMPSGAVATVTLSGGTVTVTPQRAVLAHPRAKHSATRLGSDPDASVLVAGGVDATNQPVAQAELFKPVSTTFSTTFQATMVVPRSLHQAMLLPDGSVLFIGGIDQMGNPVHVLEQFSLDAGFVPVGMLPPDAATIDFTATTLPDGRILLAGGSLAPGDPPVTTAYIANLDSRTGQVNVVKTTVPLGYPRAKHQATLLCDGTVLFTGGTTDPVPAERYNPILTGRR